MLLTFPPILRSCRGWQPRSSTFKSGGVNFEELCPVFFSSLQKKGSSAQSNYSYITDADWSTTQLLLVELHSGYFSHCSLGSILTAASGTAKRQDVFKVLVQGDSVEPQSDQVVIKVMKDLRFWKELFCCWLHLLSHPLICPQNVKARLLSKKVFLYCVSVY